MQEIKKYFSLLKPYVLLECIICILGLMSSVVALINPVLLQVVIDKVLVQSQIYLLKYIFAIFVFFFILSCLISYANGYLGTYINQGILKTLREKIFSHIQYIKLSEKLDLASGDFITKINDDSSAVASYVMSTFVAIISYISNIIATAVLMFVFNKELTMIIFGVTILEIIVSLRFTNVVRDNQRRTKKTYSRNMNFLNQFFTGFKYIKAYNREEDMSERYDGILNRLIHLNFRGYHISYAYETIIALISFAGSCLVYGMGIYFIFQGGMSIGTLFVFDIIAERFNSFASGIVNFNVDLQTVLVSVERVESLFQLEKEEDVSVVESSVSFENYDIDLKDVSFSYKEQEVLKKIQYHFDSGRTYAIVGNSGCGKSTLISILLKFYEPQEGTIQFGGNDLSALSSAEVRNQMIAVFQDAVLNEGTIEENIRYGYEAASMEEVIEAAKICNIHDFIESLPNGYQTNIGEIGDKISGGQKQRVCLARALLRDVKVYIFDEAFCNMDKNLEYEVFNNITDKCKDKMIIVISHNINLISQIENIIVLSDGKIESAGDHPYLMKNSQTYQSLYSKGDRKHEE